MFGREKYPEFIAQQKRDKSGATRAPPAELALRATLANNPMYGVIT